MRQLFPSPAPGSTRDADLAALYAYPAGPWLRGNMVASADGAGSLAGVSAGLSSDADRRVFGLLRALADVVLVGAATVRDEHYGPARRSRLWSHLRAGRPATPPIAVVSAHLDLDPASRLFTEAPPDARTVVITAAQAPRDLRAGLARHADVITAGEATVDLNAAIRALADRGHQRILTEGGPHLLAQLAADGLLDELCLTIAPLLAGPGAGRIVSGDPFPAGLLPLTLAHVLEDGGFLLCRYTRKPGLCRTSGGTPPAERFTASGAGRAELGGVAGGFPGACLSGVLTERELEVLTMIARGCRTGRSPSS
jgi:riboflavin biosynthesis pyrimidine reductase